MSGPAARDLAARSEAGFLAQLRAQFDLEALERHPWPVAGLDGAGVIVYVNPAWSRFARDNGAGDAVDRHWSLGADYFAAVAEPLRDFYRELVASAPGTHETLKPRVHEYECSSAAACRRFALQVFALTEQGGRVLVHSQLVEHAHDPATHAPAPPELARYSGTDGLVRQCAHCRRVARNDEAHRWDWVPAWVSRPPRHTTHTVCAVCYGYYYPGLGRDDPA